MSKDPYLEEAATRPSRRLPDATARLPIATRALAGKLAIVSQLLLAFLPLVLVGCAAPQPEPSPVPSSASPSVPVLRWKAVTVAGDPSLPVFDNATRDVVQSLAATGTLAGVTRLSAAARSADESPATLGRVIGAIEGMSPAEGEGCFVFLTSHGAARRGLLLARDDEALTPTALDRALARGCGTAPTVAIVSGCFTGSFTRPPMARPNRIVLSAARADRPSFGCGAGFTYTIFDECLLAALDGRSTWEAAYRTVRDCVERKEREQGFAASEPQAYFGPALAGIGLPGRDGQR